MRILKLRSFKRKKKLLAMEMVLLDHLVLLGLEKRERKALMDHLNPRKRSQTKAKVKEREK